MLIRLLAGAALLVAGCASSGTPRPAPTLDLVLAPSLNVEIDSMQRQPSGLWIRDYTIGDGPPITAGDRVGVRYTVHLTNGTRVDGTNPDSGNYVFTFGRGQVIKGWDDGMIGMRVGGRRELIIPPAMGYGFRSRGLIPSNSTLVVGIHLVELIR
jgi:FKBP-type peptidyl-prolyl cis-trans isomerase